MQRYFFDAEDGEVFRDDEGTELADAEAARVEAARMLGQLIGEDPARVWRHGRFRIVVHDGAGETHFALELSAVPPPAPRGAV